MKRIRVLNAALEALGLSVVRDTGDVDKLTGKAIKRKPIDSWWIVSDSSGCVVCRYRRMVHTANLKGQVRSTTSYKVRYVTALRHYQNRAPYDVADFRTTGLLYDFIEQLVNKG